MRILDEFAGGVAYALLILGAIVALHLSPAHAGQGVRLEILGGQCQGEPLQDGNWWSAYYPHQLERELIPNLRLGAEGGLYVYEGSFQVTVRPYPHPDTYDGWTSKVWRGWQLSPYLGLTVNSGYFMLAARRYFVIRAAEHGCSGCSGPTRGEVDMVYAGVQGHF